MLISTDETNESGVDLLSASSLHMLLDERQTLLWPLTPGFVKKSAMRLVNIHTFQLEEFFERDIPSYAIVSHRWTTEELTYQTFEEGRADEKSNGYRKLRAACRAATCYGVSYLWIDTCCIDKKSSAELSEAINSMYKWYENAIICLAYLEDAKKSDDVDTSFRNSVWFSRGWTLQELLAPQDVDFFDGSWSYIGSKESMAATIEEITGIPEHVLSKHVDILDCPIAVRMSWAAYRVSTRQEDEAYCLMGIFDVNIPPLYGEGRKAFRRLQEEIIRRTTDNTFLLWGMSNKSHRLLASRPADFDIIRGQYFPPWDSARAFSLTNYGLDINGFDILRLGPYTYGLMIAQVDSTNYILVLRKHAWLEDTLYRIGIDQLPAGSVRWFKTRRWTVLRGENRQKLEVANRGVSRSFEFDIVSDPTLPIAPVECEYGAKRTVVGFYQCEPWAAKDSSSTLSCKFLEPTKPATARILCKIGHDEALAIDLSFDFDSRPCALLYRSSSLRPMWHHSDANADTLFFGKTNSHHVWRISDCVQGLNTIVTKEDTRGWSECEMVRSYDESTKIASAFWRAPTLGPTFARVPEILLPTKTPLFVALNPNKVRSLPHCEFWEFRISKTSPPVFWPEEPSE